MESNPNTTSVRDSSTLAKQNPNTVSVKEILGSTIQLEGEGSAQLVQSLYDMMVATVEIDIARANIVRNADLNKEGFKNLRKTVEDAYEESQKTKQAVVDVLKGLYQLLMKIQAVQDDIEFEIEDNPEGDQDFQLAKTSNISELIAKVKDFENFSIEPCQKLSEASQTLIETSGGEAIRKRLDEHKEIEKLFETKFAQTKMKRDEHFKHLAKLKEKQVEEENILAQIQDNSQLKELFSNELRNLTEVRTEIKKREAAAPPSHTRSNGGWWVFSHNHRTTYDSTREELQRNYSQADEKASDVETKMFKVGQDVVKARERLAQLANELRILSGNVENALKELQEEENGLEELRKQKDQMFADLLKKSQETGQGVEQLVVTYNASQKFVTLRETRHYNQLFAAQMQSNLNFLLEQFQEFDKDKTYKRKQRRLTQRICPKPQYVLMKYLQKDFYQKFLKMIEATSKVSNILELKDIEERLNQEEVQRIQAEAPPQVEQKDAEERKKEDEVD